MTVIRTKLTLRMRNNNYATCALSCTSTKASAKLTTSHLFTSVIQAGPAKTLKIDKYRCVSLSFSHSDLKF